MVKGVEKEIRAEEKVSLALVALVTSIIFIMKEMGMKKGLRLFELMIHTLFAEKRMNTPKDISVLFSGTSTAVPASKSEAVAAKVVAVVTKPTVPLPPVIPAQPVPATAPARELSDKSPLERFIDFLAGFVAGKRRLSVQETCRKSAELLVSGIEMTFDQANTLFAAIRKADLHGMHIIDRRTDLAFLKGVPADVLSDYMFGLEGILNTLIANVRGATDKDGWIIPQVVFNVRVLSALDKKNKLGEVELSRTEALLAALQATEGVTEIKFPNSVFEELRSLVGPVDPHWKGNDVMAKKLANIHIN